MKGGPKKLGKSDSRKKFIDLDDLKDKAISVKDKNKDKLKIREISGEPFKRDKNPKLGKSDQQDLLSTIPAKLEPIQDKFKSIPWINNKKLILLIVLIIIIGIIGLFAANNIPASNNTNNTTTTPVLAENHFDNGLVSFDYPKGWNVTNGTKAPVIVTVSKDENNSFVVMNENLNTTSFSQRVLLWRQNIMQTAEITYESNITIDNTTGYNIEASYKINNTTFNARGVAVSKNNTIYFIMFIFNNSLLDYKDEMNQVINSFHIIH